MHVIPIICNFLIELVFLAMPIARPVLNMQIIVPIALMDISSKRFLVNLMEIVLVYAYQIRFLISVPKFVRIAMKAVLLVYFLMITQHAFHATKAQLLLINTLLNLTLIMRWELALLHALILLVKENTISQMI